MPHAYSLFCALWYLILPYLRLDISGMYRQDVSAGCISGMYRQDVSVGCIGKMYRWNKSVHRMALKINYG